MGFRYKNPVAPASRFGARRYIPELGHVLVRRDDLEPPPSQQAQGLTNRPVLNVRPIEQPKQYAAVEENEHQSWSA